MPSQSIPMNILKSALTVTRKLDVEMEHSDKPLTRHDWRGGLYNIKLLAQVLNVPSLTNLCQQLISQQSVYPSTIENILLKCNSVNSEAQQLQTMVRIFINMAGDDLRKRGSLKRLSRPQFKMGDKEAFKELLEPTVRRAFIKNQRLNNISTIRASIKLRGRNRHVIQKSYSPEKRKTDLRILLEHAIMTNNKELAKTFLSAWAI